MNVENDQRNKPAKWYRRWMNKFSALSIPLLLCGMMAGQVSKGTTTTVQPDGTKLHVTVDTCVSGCAGGPGGGGTSAVDEATFTQGTTQYVPIGGLFNSAITNLVSGQGGALRLTADRAAFVNVSHYGGAVVSATNPFFVTPGTGAIFSVSQNGAPWLTQSFIFNTAQPNYSVDATKAYPNISSRGEVFIAKGISGLSIDNTGFNVNNFPATQAVTQSGAFTTGRTWTLLNTTDSVNVGNFPATQPVSGTVTDTQGTPNTTANAWPVKVTDATNTAAVKAASTAALATDPSLVIALSPNSPTPTGANTIGKVDLLGNAAATLDSPVGAGTAPTNQIVTGQIFNATPPAPTTGQALARQSDPVGSSYVNPSGRIATYRMAITGATPISGVNAALCGSATKTVRLTHATFTFTNVVSTTAAAALVATNKRSTADSAGTCTTPTVVPLDSANAATSATFPRTVCTVAPTVGTLVGLIDSHRFIMNDATAAAITVPTIDVPNGDHAAQAIVLRGIAQCVDWTFTGTVTNALYDFVAEWTEE